MTNEAPGRKALGLVGASALAIVLLLAGLSTPLLAQAEQPAPPLGSDDDIVDTVAHASTSYGSDGPTLAALCRHLGLTPDQTQIYAVNQLDQLITALGIEPQPIVVPNNGEFPPTVTSTYQGADAEALVRVTQHFSLSYSDAQRLSVGVTAFLAASEFADPSGTCGPVVDVGQHQLAPDPIVLVSGSAPHQRVCWSNTNSWIPESETRELRVRVRVLNGPAEAGTADRTTICANFERGYVGPYELAVDYLAYPYQPFETTAVTGTLSGTIDLRPASGATNVTDTTETTETRRVASRR